MGDRLSVCVGIKPFRERPFLHKLLPSVSLEPHSWRRRLSHYTTLLWILCTIASQLALCICFLSWNALIILPTQRLLPAQSVITLQSFVASSSSFLLSPFCSVISYLTYPALASAPQHHMKSFFILSLPTFLATLFLPDSTPWFLLFALPCPLYLFQSLKSSWRFRVHSSCSKYKGQSEDQKLRVWYLTEGETSSVSVGRHFCMKPHGWHLIKTFKTTEVNGIHEM